MEAQKGHTLLPRGFDPPFFFAAMKCPPHSHYELCVDTCSLTCSALSDTPPCRDRCAEGCQCDAGFLSDGETCVPIEKCGCYHQGVYYEVGTRSSQAEPGALTLDPLPLPISPTACPLGLLSVSHPPLFDSPRPHWGPVCPLPALLLLSLVAGKTFVNRTMAPATLNPPLAPEVKF